MAQITDQIKLRMTVYVLIIVSHGLIEVTRGAFGSKINFDQFIRAVIFKLIIRPVAESDAQYKIYVPFMTGQILNDSSRIGYGSGINGCFAKIVDRQIIRIGDVIQNFSAGDSLVIRF